MLNDKNELLKVLGKTYCRLMPSKLGGVGVFAIRDIAKGTNPFEGEIIGEWFKLHVNDCTFC